jgi:hypothetical protein
MTVAWVASTGVSTTGAAKGTTSTTVAYVGVAAGRRAFLTIGAKPDTGTIATPSGWTKISETTGGTGTVGTADVGATKLAVYYQDMTGSESGSVTITGTSTTSIQGSMDVFSKTRLNWAPPAFVVGNDSTHATNLSATCGTWSDGGIKLGDNVLGCHSGDTDDTTTATSAPVFTQTGITFSSVTGRSQVRNTSGFQGMTYTWQSAVTAVTTRGVSNTVAPTTGFTWTVASCGPVMVVRVRDSDDLSLKTDTFADGTIDTTLWSNNYGATVSETGGRGRTACNSTDWNAFATSPNYNWPDGTRISARLYPPAAGGATTEAYQEFCISSSTVPAGTELTIYLDRVANVTYFLNRVGYSDGTPSSIAGSDPGFVGFLRSGANILMQTSPDAITWTTRRTLANPAWIPVTSSDVQFFVESHRGDGTADFAEIDSFNLIPVARDLDVRWVSYAQASSTLDLRWQVRNVVASDLDLQWAVMAQVAGSLDLRWGVRSTVSSDLSLLWLSYASVSNAVDLRWRVANTVASPLDLRWAVANQVSGTLDLRWAVLSTVSSAVDLRWSVRQVISNALDLRWTVRNLVSSGVDIRWAVRSSVAADLDLRWLSYALASADLDLRWNSAGTGLTVSSSLDLRWATRELVSAPIDMRWRVSNQIANAIDLRWAVKNTVSAPVDLRWGVREVVQAALDVRWSVRATVSAPLDLRWRQFALAANALDLRWAVLERLNVPLNLRWAVLGLLPDVPWPSDVVSNLTPRITAHADGPLVYRDGAMIRAELTEEA